MNRRGFLALLATSAVGLAVDADLANWTPHQKTYILPPPQGWLAPNGAEYWYRPHVLLGAQREYNRLQSQQMDGNSMRFIKQFDADVRGVARLDVLYGVGLIKPGLGVRIQG